MMILVIAYRGASPRRTLQHPRSRGPQVPRTARVAHSLCSFASFSSCGQLDVQREAFVGRHAVARAALQLLGPLADPSQPEAGSRLLLGGALAIVVDAELHQAVVAE